MKVFISQTMRDQKPEEILKIRVVVAQEILKKYGPETTIIDSYKPELGAKKPIKALAESISMLGDADTIACVRVDGIPTGRGCKIEESVAFEYGIKRLNVYVDPNKYTVDIREGS